MNRLYLVYILLLLLVFAGCDGDESAKVVDLVPDDDLASDSLSGDSIPGDRLSGEVSDSSVSSSSSITDISSSSRISRSSSSFLRQTPLGSSKTIRGFAQKGTPVDTSVVKLVFLDETTLEPIGKAYYGKVEGDYGEYFVQVDSMESRFVQISVSGNYSSTVSLNKVTNDIALNAIVDIDSQDSANVNLFTHLEFGRIRELVSGHSLSFEEAKSQARMEMFNLLHYVVLDKDGEMREPRSPENWGFFSNTAEDCFLMVGTFILDMLPGELSDPIFSDLLEDFAKDGEFHNDSAMYQAAKHAFIYGLQMDPELHLPGYSIGTDINIWRRDYFDLLHTDSVTGEVAYHFFDPVPDLDSFLPVFWEKELGLGSCARSNMGEVKKTRYGDFYTCLGELSCVNRDMREGLCNSTVRWMPATALERDSFS